MGLVDYPSSSSSSDEEGPLHPPASKKRKTSSLSSPPSSSSSLLPPLPPSFHDLYASTVRTATADDPALHQGRKRLIPHVAGNWPSHIYIEWHPAAEEHALLTRLVEELRSSLEHDGLLLDEEEEEEKKRELTSFLTSDLGSPLPLHISLSRPIVLRTEEKESFLEEITKVLGGGGGGGHHELHQVKSIITATTSRAFEVGVQDLAWHRSPDSDRSFLVLRVRSSSSGSSSSSAPEAASKNGGGMATTTTPTPNNGNNASHQRGGAEGVINPELTNLLTRCNKVVAQYGQPRLYLRRRGGHGQAKQNQREEKGSTDQLIVSTTSTTRAAHDAGGGGGGDDDDVGREGRNVINSNAADAADEEASIDEAAFHVSIAWSFAEPTAAIQKRTAAVFCSKANSFQEKILGIKIPVESIKVKVGNVVTSVPLAGSMGGTSTTGRRTRGSRSGDVGGLFGV